MATGSNTRSGTKRGQGSASKGTASRKRAPSKPLIIDVEAQSASASKATSGSKASGTTAGKTASKASSTSASAKAKPLTSIDDPQAEAAGLWAGPAETVADTGKTADAPAAEKPAEKPKSSDTSADAPKSPEAPVTPPASGDGGGVGAFYLFAAGLIGALLALALMFLAMVTGLVSLPDGRVDDQARALAALQERVATVESEADAGTVAVSDAGSLDPSLLEPLEADIAALSDRVDALSQEGPTDGPAVDVEGAIAEALGPVDSRIAALQGEIDQLRNAMTSAPSTDGQAPAAADPQLASRVDALGADLDALSADMGSLLNNVAAMNDETAARLDEVSAQGTALQTQLDAAIVTQQTALAMASARIDALAEEPADRMPDRLARFGVALDALVAARDGGGDVSQVLEAVRSAATFDDRLADAVAPISSAQVSGAVSTDALGAAYEDAYAAMRAAAPANENAGLLGMIEDRARQMVTIRAPEGTTLLEGGEGPVEQLDALGDLIAAGRFSDALTLATDLPAPMQQAGTTLIDGLHARVALDDAILAARSALVAALSAPTATSQ